MRFEFATATRIIFGAGRLSEAGALAAAFGRRALVVTGRRVERANRLLDILREHRVGTVTFPVPREPEIETIQAGATLGRREGCECVISFGGGSALDAGKAIAAMLTNEGDLLDYLEVIGRGQALVNAPAPFIAIPTTAGTGAEVTRNAVLASPQHRVKVSLRSPLLLPKVALVDPELTYGLPPDITARTGLDALTQLIEPFVCSRANPLTDALCVQGIPKVARSLRRAFENGFDANARQDMAVASLFGGLTLANAGLGAVHGFAGPLGGMFPALHGGICAALLPQVMEANLQALRRRQPNSDALRRYDEVARLLTGNADAKADDGVHWVRALVSDLRIPRLGVYGVGLSSADALIEKATKASSMKANPILLTPEELMDILHRTI